MQTPGKLGVAAVLAACSVCYGCTQDKAETVGKHRFAVPQSYRIPESDWPFFLPRSEDDGFIFVLNPKSPLPQQSLVVVDTRTNVCGRAAGSKAYVNFTVCSAAPLRWRNGQLRRYGDEVFWRYALVEAAANPSKAQAVLVSCFQAGRPPNGLCTAVLPFGDLVLTLQIEDADVARLAVDYDAATALLHAWERE